MPTSSVVTTPSLQSFLLFAKSSPVESSIERLISLLKRRQIRNSRPCAIATAHLLRRVVAALKVTEVAKLIERVQNVGQRLTSAQPREMAVGNIVRRVLGVIRGEAEEDRTGDTSGHSEASESMPQTPQENESRNAQPPFLSPHISILNQLRQGGLEPQDLPLTSTTNASRATSMLDLLSLPVDGSPTVTPISTQASTSVIPSTAKDLRAEVIEGIEEIIDELAQVDDQIASYALDHIHSNEIILIYTASATVQKFLLKAAAKRKFTVIHAEAFPNDHEATHAVVTGRSGHNAEDDKGTEQFHKPLIAAGITVVLIPDSAVFALMSRVNKVILGTHVVLANGGLVAAAGAKMIAQAARMHRTPVVVVTGVYKLSPVYPFDFDSLIEYGDAGKVLGYEDGDFVDKVDVENPLYDYVPAELVDLYITNLGGHAPSYLYRIVSDHYRPEDINLNKVD